MQLMHDEKPMTFGGSGKTKERPTILLSHPTGNQYVRNALRSLAERDMLAEFWTTIAWNPGSRWNRILPAALRRQMVRRAFAEAPRKRVKNVPWREVVRLGARSSPFAGVLCSGEGPFSVIEIFRHFDARVAERLKELDVDAVYAHEGGALQTFREAKRRRVRTFYELPSGYWTWERKLLAEEIARNPDLATVIPKMSDSERHLREKDEELSLADRIIVPSHHIRRTLAGVVPDHKISVVPYGAPPVRIRPERRKESGGPLKVVFAGALHQRKGIGYLLRAVEMLGQEVDLTLIGRRYAANAVVDAACGRWRWHESIPHEQVLEVMTDADVLVLPSISEGFGMVVTEALACGLPVIITPNVGASDVVEDGRQGFIVPVGSAGAIAERLTVLHRDRELLARMSIDAQAAAVQNSWETYRESWASAVKVGLCY